MIIFTGISKQYGSSVIFTEVTISLNENDRTGLVGVNGSGKTTLLRMLNGQEIPDKGSMTIPSQIKIGYLPQEVETFDEKTPLEIVLEPFEHLLNYEENIHNLASGIDQGTGAKEVMRQIDNLHNEMEFHDGYSLQARAEAILTGLGISREQWSRRIQELSGGYRMRTVLGRLLLTEPDYLLLDEPTNHLDMDSLVWLEKFLMRYKGGMLIVSHDRDFLNRITSFTAEISGGNITLYKGNYESFVKAKAEIEANTLNRVKNLEIRIAHAERFVERFKAKNTKATQAQSRIKLIENLKAEMPDIPQGENKHIHFTLPVPKPSGLVPFKIDGIEVRYWDFSVFTDLSLSITRGEKVAILGPNGAGKTTLLRVMGGYLKPERGSFETGHNTVIRYFGQHQLEQLDPERTVYETVARGSVNTEKTFVRNILGAFLFSGDSVDKQVKVLSGGEKSRLVLAAIMASPGNTLLLDEPTNHLDIQSVAVLADAMTEFSGTIVFVSHDDYFVSKIATRILEMRPGLLRDFPGTLADYRAYIESGFEYDGTQKTEKDVEKEDDAREKKLRIREREARKKLTRGIEKQEREIAAIEEQIASLKAVIDNPLNGTNHELLQMTTLDLEEKSDQLNRRIHEWERLHTELEDLNWEKTGEE